MAPNPIGRPRRSRRRPPAAAALPKDRLPVGTRRTFDPIASTSHIQIVPRLDDDNSQLSFEENTPVHTNPSYLSEIGPGLDLHKRESHQRQLSTQTTFADMARASVESDHATGKELMASQEPQSLNNFIRFKKKGRGRQWSPIDEETCSTRTPSPLENIDNQFSQKAQNMAFRLSTNVNVNPVDALRAHIDNVRATFGRPLPDPSYLTANFGQRDREIQFVLHPNGDIHAHQWLAQSVEWQPVGQYIYGRKVLEGILSQEPLRGQKIGSNSPQNILQRFIAVAKQYEEASIAKATEPKGYEPSTARSFIRPAIPLVTAHPQRPPLSMDRSFSSAGYSSQSGGGLPTLSNMPIRHPAPTRPRPPPIFGEDMYETTNERRSSPPLQAYNSSISPLLQRKHSTPEPTNLPLITRNSFGSSLSKRGFTDSTHSSLSNVVQPGIKVGYEERLQAPGIGRSHQRPMIIEEGEISDEAISPTTTRLDVKGPTRSSLVNDTDKVKPTPVMKKPAQPNPFASWTSTNHKRNSIQTPSVHVSGTESGGNTGLGTGHNPNVAAFGSNRAYRSPTYSGTSESHVALDQSEPEAGYSQRQCHVLTKLSTGNMTNEELMMYSRPTPQDWKGPFFEDIEDLRTEEGKLMDWWRSGEMSKRKNWKEVHGTYSSKYTSKIIRLPDNIGYPVVTGVPGQQDPIGTASPSVFGTRGGGLEWRRGRQ